MPAENIILEMIDHHAKAGMNLRELFFRENRELIKTVGRETALCLAGGNKILLCGNGGSAADAQHLAAEFVNRFELDRPPLPAIALTTDSSILTAIGNDFSFEQIFSKQVQALGNQGDMLFAISTSGNSTNVLRAIEVAKEKQMLVVGLTGNTGGKMASVCDYLFNVPEANTALVQEIHIALEHLLCRLTDYYLFENALLLEPYL
ncbi:D-sedoheptulose 7-phosphate isomerase [Desulfovibrio litoralis]|uniref:Phosphoheptose isomerase n=1 Tax=Desulfovibrio litoralis DSM 11393 TaxID=1121455 RepID=A0A1M7T5K1_9BACT|nr:D-sedoheptulose 7-phosphate isomerase [Desulfovibrio litoralis]SHN66023.1 phosphoheptose isomerase [Desulfovibrio litoralis DSM 11393]